MSTTPDTGTGIGRPKKPLACPRCAVPLESVRIDDVGVDRCATCHGLWFDVNELDRVMAQGAPGLRAMTASESAPAP
ncbi:MAG: zf-TFIIB domain-containing protein, partial [Planctomycetes bacterium]|nr:zf-TFIIB domain-containing protein [Planctomycetota bacterium]